MSRLMIGLISIQLMVSGVSHGADEKGGYEIVGIGSDQCTELLKYHEGSHTKMVDYSNWLAGYLTNYNLMQGETNSISGVMNMNDMVNLLHDFCKISPRSSVAEATQAMTIYLYPHRIRSTPENL